MQKSMKAGDGTILYGEMTFSDLMTEEGGLAWGLYSFPAQDGTTFSNLTLHNTICANGGGAYRKGKLHFVSYYEDMGGALGYLYLVTMDLATYDIERKAISSDKYSSIGTDMTYDPIGDLLYSVTYDEKDLTFSAYQLATIDINTGLATPINAMARMSAIACDNMGQLYGIRYSDGMLVKIDKATPMSKKLAVRESYPYITAVRLSIF